MENKTKAGSNSEPVDLLSRSSFLSCLEKYVAAEQSIVEGSLVLSLGAPFGSGKTTFIEMWRRNLEKRAAEPSAQSESSPVLVVGINAWEADYHADPLAIIALSIIEALEEKQSDSAKIIADRLGGAFRFLAGGAKGALRQFSTAALGGFDPIAGVEDALSSQPGDPVVLELKARKKCMAQIKDAVREACGGEGVRTYIFVDELDRCRPDYAIAYLEVIKHLFDIKGVVFVLAVDEGQLESAAKSVFGDGLDFKEYFRKFVHRSVSLPPVTRLREHERTVFIENYFLRYLKLSSGTSDVRTLVEFVDDLISIYEVTPRNFQEIMRVMAHARYRPGVESGRVEYLNDARLFLMSFLRVVSPDDYRRFGSGSFDFEKLEEIMIGLRQLDRHRDGSLLAHRFSLIAHGFKLTSTDAKQPLERHLGTYFGSNTAEALTKFNSSGSRGGMKYAEIFQNIEALLTLER